MPRPLPDAVGPDGRGGITVELVQRLLAQQFPRWAGLPVRPVPADGWDNRTYRLGDDLLVRLPSAAGYAAAVAKEDRWLRRLAPGLPLRVPEPVATGRPGAGYPWSWSVRRWIPGRPVLGTSPADPVTFARDLAAFLRALRALDPAEGPAPGAHCFHRGGPPAFYDAEVRAALDSLGATVDGDACRAVWASALASSWTGPPVWFHGDVAVGNLLLDDEGVLSAVLDFGTCGVGDPACDLVVTWTLLRDEARAAFRAGVGLDDATWARARGWALWKALIVLAGDATDAAGNRGVVAEVLADHARS
ncbi:Predicted kinase, aminoglycoside phosphotransferase (APT) family [Friedmanniella luteola]|uniref:Predicted kinase, aminoglycoside phosphotransferase (APT) family n=1 Tax=Friedmanniella luteola TaxID=546871 RepID=A0A1H1ZE14_9ACTN|nr:aminoglycoside phosphotransferase family protein [Friedmanniella luteola]SDT32031.1 Predicted kinase, aminoglycoside phosphotransferase (APT) family [Friedmanniella luteola]